MERFIPKKADKEVISVRISALLLEKVDQIASKNDISRNELINQCITFALEHLDEE